MSEHAELTHFEPLARACKALSHPARLTILQVLARRGTCICGELVDVLPLSQATVSCFLQDRVGFMWIGTQDGLNRFDGYSFVVYKNDPGDPSTLSNSWIQALLEEVESALDHKS